MPLNNDDHEIGYGYDDDDDADPVWTAITYAGLILGGIIFWVLLFICLFAPPAKADMAQALTTSEQWCRQGNLEACQWHLDHAPRAPQGLQARQVLRFLGAVGDTMVINQQRSNGAFRPMVLCRNTALGVQCQ